MFAITSPCFTGSTGHAFLTPVVTPITGVRTSLTGASTY